MPVECVFCRDQWWRRPGGEKEERWGGSKWVKAGRESEERGGFGVMEGRGGEGGRARRGEVAFFFLSPQHKSCQGEQ